MKPAHLLTRQPHRSVSLFSGTVLRVAAVFLVICGVTFPRIAQAGKHHSHPNAYNVINAVNEEAQTVTFGTEHSKDHSEKSLKINGFTEITVDGIKATLHDLKPGMMVHVDEDTDNIAKTIEAQHHNKK